MVADVMTVLSAIAAWALVWALGLSWIVYRNDLFYVDKLRGLDGRIRDTSERREDSIRRMISIEELLRDLGNDLALYEMRLDKLEPKPKPPSPKTATKPKKPPVKRANKQAKPARKV
jgi:hypothetical protein